MKAGGMWYKMFKGQRNKVMGKQYYFKHGCQRRSLERK